MGSMIEKQVESQFLANSFLDKPDARLGASEGERRMPRKHNLYQNYHCHGE